MKKGSEESGISQKQYDILKERGLRKQCSEPIDFFYKRCRNYLAQAMREHGTA